MFKRIKFFKTLTLPDECEGNAFYYVGEGVYAEGYLTSDAGVPRPLGNSAMINELILQALAGSGVENSVAQSAAVAEAAALMAQAIQQQLPSPQQFLDIINQLNAILSDPANAVTSWEIPAKAFDLVQGSASFIAAALRLGAWSMPNGAASYLSTLLAVPSHWRTMDVYVKWVNNVANNGNVVLGGEIHKFAMGESINVAPVGGSGIQAAIATPWLAKESKVAADLIVDPSRLTILRIARQGLSANDTLLNPISIFSVRLVKKS